MCEVDWGVAVGVIQTVLAALALIVAVAGLCGLIKQISLSNKQRFFGLKLDLIRLLNDSQANSKKTIIEIINLTSDLDRYIDRGGNDQEVVDSLVKIKLQLGSAKDRLTAVDGLLDGLLRVMNSGDMEVSVLENTIEKVLSVCSKINELSDFPSKLRAQLKSKNITFPSP